MKKVWDRLGIAFSSACVLHCIAVAFLPLLFPAVAHIAHQSWVHWAVGATIMFTTPLAFVPGFRKHGLTWIIALASAGLFLIVFGIILENHYSEQVSHGISILGSLCLVMAHAKNIQHSHRHKHQCC